jgi:uncharacterized protein YjbI with pentapeptide repeats
MANKEHLEILKQGVKVWNKWCEDNPGVKPNLRWANLRGYGLGRYDLRGVSLTGADLSYAGLGGADLRRADLSYADLNNADLTNADLSGANLIDANLSYTNLLDCIGNNKEVVTFGTEFYTVNFTRDFLNIGCKTYSYEEWFSFTDDEIYKMASDSLEFWNKYKETIKELKIKYGF